MDERESRRAMEFADKSTGLFDASVVKEKWRRQMIDNRQEHQRFMLRANDPHLGIYQEAHVQGKCHPGRRKVTDESNKSNEHISEIGRNRPHNANAAPRRSKHEKLQTATCSH
jgi:hypothetical protein